MYIKLNSKPVPQMFYLRQDVSVMVVGSFYDLIISSYLQKNNFSNFPTHVELPSWFCGSNL